MNKRLIFFSPFNALKSTHGHKEGEIHKTLTNEWILYRFNFWKNYTYKSLCNQTTDNFEYWLKCDIDTKEILESLFYSLGDKRIKLVYMNCEDPERTIREYPRFDLYYLTRIDSDDMYERTVAEEILSYKEPNIHLVYKKGYLWDTNNNKIYDYLEPFPPFFTFCCNYDTFKTMRATMQLAPFDHLQRLPHITLSENKYIVCVHRKNDITMTQGNYFCSEKEAKFLKNFGYEDISS